MSEINAAKEEAKRLIEFWNNYNYATEEGKEKCLYSAQSIDTLLNYIKKLEDKLELTKNITPSGYINGKYLEEIANRYVNKDRIRDKITEFYYEYEKAKRKNDNDRADFYWDLIKHLKNVLGE